MGKRFNMILVALLCSINFSLAQDIAAYEARQYINEGDTLPYRISFPKNFDEARQYPVLLFLHGAGERGNDNIAQLIHGGKLLSSEGFRREHEAIVLFPQCPTDSYWSNVSVVRDTMPYEFDFKTGGAPTMAMRLLLGLTDELFALPYVDRSRLYVGGLSMGGMGTFELLRRKSDTFAAAIAICGGDNPKNAPKYADGLNIWIFHGREDDVVPVKYSQIMADTLQELGANVRLTIYPEIKHDSWTNAFAEPGLWTWLFSFSK